MKIDWQPQPQPPCTLTLTVQEARNILSELKKLKEITSPENIIDKYRGLNFPACATLMSTLDPFLK